MYRLALALLILALAPAAAEAAPFGELPVQSVQNPARCLRATGAPGEVVRWAPEGAEFQQATASGFSAPVKIALGESFLECPIVKAKPTGAAVVIENVDDGIAFAVREPGGAWGPNQLIEAKTGHFLDDPAVAISPRGDVAVGWTDTTLVNKDLAARVMVMRRPAGGKFGAPEELQKPTPYRAGKPHVVLGMQVDGTVLALWNPDNPEVRERQLVLFTSAAPGAAFATPVRISSNLELNDFSLTTAPDGRAIAIVDEGAHTRVLERPPGGAFAQVADLGYAETFLGAVAVALRPDGAAVVAWQDLSHLQVKAIRRGGLGPFSKPERVGVAPEHPYGEELSGFPGGAPTDHEGRGLAAAFAGNGQPVLTWAPTATLGKLNWTPATVTTFSGAPQALSGPLRDADSVTPVILADGTPAVAWSDVSTGGDSHLHLAIEGAAAVADPPAPNVVIGRITQIRHGLGVPFRCSAACDVRATVPDGVVGTRSLRAAGSGTLKLLPDFDPIMLTRADSANVQVLTGAAGGRAATSRNVKAKLRVPRLPRLEGLAAVRRGKKIVVTWHTAGPLRRASVVGIASSTRALADPFFGSVVEGKGRRHFRLTVGTDFGKAFVQLFLFYEPDATERRIAVVPVRDGKAAASGARGGQREGQRLRVAPGAQRIVGADRLLEADRGHVVRDRPRVELRHAEHLQRLRQ